MRFKVSALTFIVQSVLYESIKDSIFKCGATTMRKTHSLLIDLTLTKRLTKVPLLTKTYIYYIKTQINQHITRHLS